MPVVCGEPKHQNNTSNNIKNPLSPAPLFLSLNLQESHADCNPRSSVVVVSPLFSSFLIRSLYPFLSVEKSMAKKCK